MLALLQLDSVAVPLLERLLAEGRMPVLAELRRRGRWHELDARATILQSATYPTLATGVDVTRHGIYSSFLWSAAEQRSRLAESMPKPETIWARLSRSGRRALVVDPVLAWPPSRPTRMAGVYLSGWQFADRFLMPGRSRPRRAIGSLARRHGRAPQLDDVYGAPTAASLLELRDGLVAAPARAARAAEELLQTDGGFDLAWVNFAAAHKAGHHLWDASAVVEAPLDHDSRRRLDSGLADVYAAVDAALGRVIAALPADADLLVFSPTGMAANLSLADLLPGMVDAVLRGPRPAAATGRARAPVWSLRGAVPKRWRARVANLLPRPLVADLTTRLYVRADWTRARAFAVPGENRGYVRLNLRGRERHGLVEPADAGPLLDELAAGLRTFSRPDGAPAIARVARMSELAGSPAYAGGLPDLVVYWNELPAAGVERVSSPRFGEVSRRGAGSGRSGNHVDEAWALLVPGTSRPRELDRPPRVVDLGATACGLLEADVEGLSGSPLFERAG